MKGRAIWRDQEENGRKINKKKIFAVKITEKEREKGRRDKKRPRQRERGGMPYEKTRKKEGER